MRLRDEWEVRTEDGKRVLVTQHRHRLDNGCIVATESRQPLHSLEDLMVELGITEAELDGIEQYTFVDSCVCGHPEEAHGQRCYYETECGCRDYQADTGRDNG